MSDNIVQLPRPAGARPEAPTLGLYLRVGYSQHKELMEIFSEGETSFHGVIVDAQFADRQKDLILEASQKGLDVILDPKTQPMATVGGNTASLSSLSWGSERHHRISDVAGENGLKKAAQIVKFALDRNFSQVIGMTHLIDGPNSPWLHYDIANMGHMRGFLRQSGKDVPLIYSLALPIRSLRNAEERKAVVAAVANAPFDALWLKVDNFGSDATGEKTAAYIEACADFENLGVPVIADHAGGLPGLALLAFGSVSGLAHGVAQFERFRGSGWNRVTKKNGGGAPSGRVYLSRLDLFMKPAEAKAFLRSSKRALGRYGCRDTHCCPHGLSDMLDRPARHFVHQRIQEVHTLGTTPPSLRVSNYMDNHVRRVSDDVAAAAGIEGLADEIHKKLQKKQAGISRFRKAMGHLAAVRPAKEPIALPESRAARESKR